MPSLIRHDLGILNYVRPNMVVLVIGSNDLAHSQLHPTTIGSGIEELTCRLHFEFGVDFIMVNQVHYRSLQPHTNYNSNVDLLNQYLTVVINQHPFASFWRNVGLKDSRPHLLPDGVHLNPVGQYMFYRSVRGAIIKAASTLGMRLENSN